MHTAEKGSVSYISGCGDLGTRNDSFNNFTDNLDAFQSKEHILGAIQLEPKNHRDLENAKQPNCKSENSEHQVKHPTSYMDTMLHIFKGNIGSGLLAMGDAFKNGGLIFAPIMTAVLGIISVYSQHILRWREYRNYMEFMKKEDNGLCRITLASFSCLLLECADKMHLQTKQQKPPNFAETVGLVFATGPIRLRPLARVMKGTVNLFLCVTQLGFCCVYIVFIANNIKTICDKYGVNFELSIHMIFVIIPVLLACMVRNLKYLTPFSTIANVLMITGVGVVIFQAAQDLPAVSTREYVASWRQLPLFFGTAIYAFEGIGLVLPLRNEMRNPHSFEKPMGVLNVSMVIVGIIFMITGFLGYLKWGDDVMGSLTLNLDPDNVLSNVVQGAIGLAILFTYPLQFYVPVDISWPAIRKKVGNKYPVSMELAYRALLVLITFVLAESIPELGLFISLVGAISSTALALIFPPLIELVMKSEQKGGITTLMILKNCCIMLLGIFIFVTGTFESIASIVKAFQR